MGVSDLKLVASQSELRSYRGAVLCSCIIAASFLADFEKKRSNIFTVNCHFLFTNYGFRHNFHKLNSPVVVSGVLQDLLNTTV